eukprot:CAMPEP_0173380828 /NCGR_PEP_ID=MMETSP1356-20130122/3427_1 /TAXON_ID=77927 ORGANISM="Hemiselmis virescens, Strain PCC157" /NCGR_SAMPLE_ID=MMETSP1356 /ASSEMBLY_ACC=CAM_ASM_000847 /LENGTH=333 /DNA_ID=CAMNT_0014334539 /DNA_START=14 /DNA_END=1012 /DNA_ORIENTATION=-
MTRMSAAEGLGDGGEKKLTKGEMQKSLDELAIKYNRSATKEELARLLSRAACLRSGATDMGSTFNTGGPLSVAMGHESFWDEFGHFKWIGTMSMVCKSFQSVLVTELAWRACLRQMPTMAKKDITFILALPESQFVNIQSVPHPGASGPSRDPYAMASLPKHFVAESALAEALRHHKNMENVTLARAKKTKQRQKEASKPKQSSTTSSAPSPRASNLPNNMRYGHSPYQEYGLQDLMGMWMFAAGAERPHEETEAAAHQCGNMAHQCSNMQAHQSACSVAHQQGGEYSYEGGFPFQAPGGGGVQMSQVAAQNMRNQRDDTLRWCRPLRPGTLG